MGWTHWAISRSSQCSFLPSFLGYVWHFVFNLLCANAFLLYCMLRAIWKLRNHICDLPLLLSPKLHSSQCSTTGVTKPVVCAILSQQLFLIKYGYRIIQQLVLIKLGYHITQQLFLIKYGYCITQQLFLIKYDYRIIQQLFLIKYGYHITQKMFLIKYGYRIAQQLFVIKYGYHIAQQLFLIKYDCHITQQLFLIKYDYLVCFVSAVTFLEYWKRKNASLAHHWDVMGFEEEGVDICLIYLMTCSTHFNKWVYLHQTWCLNWYPVTIRRNEMFYLMTHSTHFIYGFMASDMVKDHSVSERRNPLPPHRLLFPISSKDSFIFIIPQTG